MLQLQSTRKPIHDWKKKEPNFLQKNKLALKQNAKQSSLRTTATNKSQLNPKETGNKKTSVARPPLRRPTRNPPHHQQQQQQSSSHVINEDSVVISKSALDSLLKQLVDAKQAANVLPPIDNKQDDSIAPPRQANDDGAAASINLQHKVVTPNHAELRKLQQKEQHDSKHKDLDYSDVPGLSPIAPQTARDYSHEEGYLETHEKKRNTNTEQVYFPFGRPGGGAPNRLYHSNQTETSHGISDKRFHNEQQQSSAAIPTSKYSPQDAIDTSPRCHQPDISLSHNKSVYLDDWQIKEKELKRRKNLEHCELVKAQIAEKERQKEEARQRKALEEKQEEERVAKQREKLQREYQEEQERVKRKEEELARRNALMYQKIQEAKSTALEVKHQSKPSPRFNHNNNISVPAIFEESHCSDYESGTDDPDSRTNLEQVKVRLSFDSALRSPSMCNVIPDNSQGQEQSPSPRKQAVKTKSKPSVQQENSQSKGLEVVKQRKGKNNSLSKVSNATSSQKELKETSHGPNKVGKTRERKPSKIPVPTKELLKNHSNEEEVRTEHKQNGELKCKQKVKERSAEAQKGHRVSRNKVHKMSAKQVTSATQSNSNVRNNSPPVPALAKKLEKPTTNNYGQHSNHNLPSLSTHTSKRAQEKAAKKLHSTNKETSMPLANSVARLQKISQSIHQQQHLEHLRPLSPPVPALANKLQAQSLQKSSLAEFDSHNRSVLPPITDIGASDETAFMKTFSLVQNSHSQPTVEFRSNSPPVPALAKQISQQRSQSLNHSDNRLPAGVGLTPKELNQPASPELTSESQFTYPPEVDGRVTQTTNHKLQRCSQQQAQPVMYIPVSPQQFQIPTTLYSQCSMDDPLCCQSSQQAYYVAPQIVSPVHIMVPPFSLSPPQPHHQQAADIEKRRENDSVTLIVSKKENSQPQFTQREAHTTVDSSVQEQGSRNSTSAKPLERPPTAATAGDDNTGNENEKDNKTVQCSPAAAATPQMSQQKEAVLQQLAIMKKRLLAQQQSITKRQLSSSFKSLQQ